MSQQSKPRVYTFDEICESQDFNHEHEFVDKQAFDRVVEALKFYADKSLGNGAYVFRKKFMFDLINEADLEALCEPVGAKGERYVVGGKLAREALKEVGEL